MSDETVKFILERIDLMRQDIESVRQGVAALRGEHVCRPEHDALARRVATLEEDARSKHIPWPLIVSAVSAALILGFSLYA